MQKKVHKGERSSWAIGSSWRSGFNCACKKQLPIYSRWILLIECGWCDGAQSRNRCGPTEEEYAIIMASNVSMRPQPKSKLLKVVILGNGGIGKTCLMNRFVSDHYDENSFHTIGVEFLKKDLVVDGLKYTLQVGKSVNDDPENFIPPSLL